jgi:YggT family protein
MGLLIGLIDLFFTICFWVIIIQVAVSWLVAFDVINSSNPSAQRLMGVLHRLTEPVYKPIRKYVPPIGGIDLTPLIVMIGLSILERLIIGILI